MPVISLAALVVVVTSIPAAAQPLGTVRWQLQPYCNVLTLAITQNGTVFTLDGVDDLCGAGPASALGTAFFNPDGTVGMGLHLVAAPGAAPIHITVVLNTATLSGSWTDSAGNGGVFQVNPPTPAAGVPRPPGGGLAGVAVTNVVAGAGLTGGGMGPVNLAVAFEGPGAAATAARSDHTHAKGSGGTAVGEGALAAVTTGTNNTAVGDGAAFVTTAGANNTALGHLALFTNQVGGRNTAVGAQALRVATGNDNTAVGYQSLTAATTGDLNAAFGNRALFSNTIGTLNTAIGAQSLVSNTTGWKQTALGSYTLHSSIGTGSTENTAVGYQALAQVTTGDRNIGIGASAGLAIKTGSHNILIGNVGGPPEENWTIRIGTDSSQTRTFIAGIRGVTTAGAAIPVVVDTDGQLGTISSSRRFKKDIADLGDAGLKLQQLRPVQFRYKQADASGPLQYGLIAEEVHEVLPELVVRSADGHMETVQYHILPALLVAEVQRLERERQALTERLAALEALVRTLTKR